MRRKPIRPPLKNGLGRVGPFHPYLAYAAVMLVNLAGVLVGIAILVGLAHLISRLF